MVDTVRWEDGRVVMIDQRLLPGEVVLLRCAEYGEVAHAIERLAVRGAPAIGVSAAYGLALAASRAPRDNWRAVFSAAGERFAATRPTAVNLFWAIERMRQVAAAASNDQGAACARLLQEARAIHEEDLAACHAIGDHGAPLLPQPARVLTHCNAGALATAGYGTALGVIRSAARLGRIDMVFADETRPVLQGARLTAWELQQDGIPVTLITDNMAGHLMARGEINAVIVGADRITANGDVANKIGTYSVAVLAKEHALPFFVAAPVSTFDLQLADGMAIPIEERAAEEVTHHGGRLLAPAGVRVRNPAFDVTPARLITAIICEHGVARAPYAATLRSLADR